MWLTKDERKTLVFYYETWSGGCSSFPFQEPFDQDVHVRLREQGMILFDIDSTGGRVSLTHDGIDLGRRYKSWWLRSNPWYTEYIKYHWICVVGSFGFGILSHWLLSKIIV